MKKLAILFAAVFAVTVLSSSVFAQTGLFEMDCDDFTYSTTSVEIDITFQGSGLGNTLAIWNWAEDDELSGETATYTGPACLQNKRYLIDRYKLEVKPEGLYEVKVYTDRLTDTDEDQAIDGFESYAGVTDWTELTLTQVSNYIGENGGLEHQAIPGYVMSFKLWCEVTAGELTADCDTAEVLPPPVQIVDNDQIVITGFIHDFDCDSIAFCWFGNTDTRGGAPTIIEDENDPNYIPGSYLAVPEKLAIAVDAADKDKKVSEVTGFKLGTYHKIIASTKSGSIIMNDDASVRRLPIGIGCDLLNVGKGQYKGDLVFELVSN